MVTLHILLLIQVDQCVGELTLRTSMGFWLTAGWSQGGVTWTVEVCWVLWCRKFVVLLSLSSLRS